MKKHQIESNIKTLEQKCTEAMSTLEATPKSEALEALSAYTAAAQALAVTIALQGELKRQESDIANNRAYRAHLKKIEKVAQQQAEISAEASKLQLLESE